MVSIQQQKEKITETKEKLSECVEVDCSLLGRRRDLSNKMNFEEVVPILQEMQDSLKQLEERDISRLSSSHADHVRAACDIFLKHVERIQSFEIEGNNPKDNFDGIVGDIKAQFDAFFHNLIVPLAFTASQATDFAKVEREAKGCLSEMQNQRDEFTTYLDGVRSQAVEALNAVQQQAAQAGVSSNAEIFKNTADDHKNSATRWFWATVVLAISVLFTALVFLQNSYDFVPTSTAQAIQYVFSKLLVISSLSFALFWASRNFKAHKHNETLYRHRASALMTFKAFVEGTKDTRVKDAILLQAAQAAFSARPTGFDGTDGDSSNIMPVVEVIGKTLPKVTPQSQ